MAPKTSPELAKWISIAWVVLTPPLLLCFVIFGESVGFRVLGAVLIVSAGVQQWAGAVPYGGWKEPAGYLTGWVAVAVNVVIGITGLAMLILSKSPWAMFF
jgi:hypothetical protein